MILTMCCLIIGAGLFLMSKLNLSLADASRIVKSGFSIASATNEEIYEHISKTQKYIDIIHYDINIELYTDQKLIKGSTIITGMPNASVKKIELNFNDGYEILNVKLNEENVNYSYDDDMINIISKFDIVDTFRIKIDYKGVPERLGFGSFTFGELNGESVTYTLNEPIYASTWFPCNDFPSDKVLTDVYITNDSSMTSVSNGVLKNVITNGNRKTYHWQTIYPISTYLISIYSANYIYYFEKYISAANDTMNIDYYVFEEDLEEAKQDFKIHKNALKHFSELFGEYPFIKEKYGVAQFLWSFGAMEHQTITGIGRNFVSGHQFFTGMLVHELAHQWWGNAVTLAEWKDIWLNEGFATYAEALYWEKENGFSALKSTMKSYLTNFNGTTLYNPENLFSRIIYNKGAWVLHMLRKELGDNLFFKVLKVYYNKYKYKNASIENFTELVEEESGENYSWFFKQWIYDGEGKLELEYNYTQTKKNESYLVDFTFNQVQEGYGNYNFLLDFDFYLDDGSKIRDTIRVSKREFILNFSFKKRVTKIDLDPDNWIAAQITFKETENK